MDDPRGKRIEWSSLSNAGLIELLADTRFMVRKLRRLMQIFAKTKDEQVGIKLVDSLQRCPAATSLPVELLKQQLSGIGVVVARAESLSLHAPGGKMTRKSPSSNRFSSSSTKEISVVAKKYFTTARPRAFIVTE